MAVSSSDSEAPPADPVLEWRVLYAVRLGFGRRQARELALSRVDMHEVERLLRAGCSRELAVRILKDP